MTKFRWNLLKSVIVATTPVFVPSCANTPMAPDTEQETASVELNKAPSAFQLESSGSSQPDVTVRSSGATLITGNDKVISIPPLRPPIVLDGEAVMVNFEQAPLSEVVHSIMAEILSLDYVIEHPVKGNITLRTRSPVPRSQLLPILESLLRNNNVMMIRGPDDRFFISGSANARSTLPRYESGSAGGFGNVIVPLQYISAKEMADILKPVVREDSLVRVDSRRNLLVLAGTQLQLDGWLEIISIFDIDQLAGVSVGIFPLKNSSSKEIHSELMQILTGDVAGDSSGMGVDSMVNIIPVERLNSIMVISPREHYIATVGNWVKTLDNIDEESSEPTLNVYPVRNGNAAQLANLLSTIFINGKSNEGSVRAPRQSVAPGMRATSTGISSEMPDRGASDNRPTASFELGDGVRVVADEYNNSLLVLAPPYEYQKIERILSKLDVVATQVLIEASIIEVTLTDDFEFGLEWAFDNDLGGGDFASGVLDLGAGLGSRVPGFSYSIADSAGAVKAVVNALAEKSLINVISTPSVMVLDNHTAAIHVGDQQPIRSAATLTNGGNVQTSIQYKDTGVKLQVTPSVNDGGLVTLDIEQSITDVGPVDAATGQRSFLERNVSSRVAIRSGESVVLGGLIRDNDSVGRSGIPLLMDIPILGSLFSTTNDVSSRTELLIFISPRVLEGVDDLRELNREMRARMKGLTDFSDLPVNFGDSSSVLQGE